MDTEKTLAPKAAKKKLIPVFDLFENSWKTYFENFKGLVTISLYSLFGMLAVLIGVVLVSGLAAFIGFKGQESLLIKITVIALMILVAAATLAVAIWYSTRSKAGIYLMIKNNFNSVKESWLESKKIFWPFFWLSLLVTLLVLLWMILLFIPGIIFAVFYSFAIIIFVFEGQGGMKAIRASKNLVKGYWWSVFGRLAFLGLVVYLLAWLLGIPVTATEDNIVLSTSLSLINSIIILVISPFLYIYSVKLYQNLKEVKK
jgi:uncharacterized membrane protein